MLIRIYKGETIEITETVSDSTSFSNYQPEYPFDDTKFIIAYRIDLQASDYNCVYESTYFNIYQHNSYRDENDNPQFQIEYYDFEQCSNTHFSDKDFEDIPVLNYTG